MADNNIASSIGIHQEYKDIIDNLYLKFSEITKTLDINDVDTVYKILCYFLQNSIYRTATISVINNISDDLKIKCFEYFYKNIQEQNINYIFAMPVLFTMLLNIKEEKTAIWSLEELNSSELIGVYKDIVCFILNKEQNHILKSYIKKVYESSSIFEQERNSKTVKKSKQEKLNADIQAMESREEEILLNKNALLTEISNVFQFIDRNKDFYPDETERGKLLYLRIQAIQDEINFDYKNSYQVPSVFSSSVINFLFDISDNNKNINRQNLENYINNWFQSDKFYWRFIFQFFVHHSEDDKAINFILSHKRIYEKIEKSMEQEMNEFMKTCTVSNFDIQGVQHPIITPFIYYVQNMYDNKCPAWFDKTNILNFCFISCWYFSISPGIRITTEFSCGDFSSVYDWLSKVFDCSTDDMLEYCITNIHHIQNEDLYAQCMDFILKNIDNDKFKNKIEDLLFLSTKKEIQAYKNTKRSSTVNSVISLFWRRCTNNEYIDKILEMEIPDTEQINIKDNYCQIEIENYIIKYATLTQKKYIIKILKKKISNNNVLIFLSRLGYKKAVHLEINNYCNGKTLDQEILFGVSSPFGYMKKSTGLLIAFISLFMYSIADDTDRRQALQHIACNGIQAHITKRNFFIFKIKFNALIKKLQQENKYYDSVENFKNEITQYTFLQ